MKFGHRGQNHPVLRASDGRILITSQNHGFAVDSATLDGTDLEQEYTHANDRTVEGLRHRRAPLICVQFHPEASPGPLDSQYIFDDFINLMRRSKK